jgi:hypothetical protein
MAWVSTVEIGRGKRRGKLTDILNREYYRYFEVRFSTLVDDVEEALTAPLLPALSSVYQTPVSIDLDALCQHLYATEQKEWQASPGHLGSVWLIEAFYSSEADDPTKQQLNPLLDPPNVTYGGEKVEVAIQSDLDEVVVVNSAGDPYDPPLAVDDYLPVITIEVNIPWFGLSLQQQYLWSCNANPMWGQGVGIILCTQFDAKLGFRNNQQYWAATAQFKLMSILQQNLYSATWLTTELVDQGFRENAAGQMRQILDEYGHPVSKPALLNGSGLKQVVTPPAKPVLYRNSFTVRTAVDFSPLNLPASV